MHTAHDIYQFDGHIPEIAVLGETADISQFCEFGFWDWVKFRDKVVIFPDKKLVLGNYLGPSIDVGPAMMQRVMKTNGEVKDRSTVRLLTPKECVNASFHKEQEHFLSSVTDRCGQGTMVKDLGPDILNLIPDPENYDPWEDEDGPSFPALYDKLTAANAAGDYLINSEVLLLIGNLHELV